MAIYSGFTHWKMFHSQWEFQDPKMEVLCHIRPYFGGISPYIGLTKALHMVGTSNLGSWNGHWHSDVSLPEGMIRGLEMSQWRSGSKLNGSICTMRIPLWGVNHWATGFWFTTKTPMPSCWSWYLCIHIPTISPSIYHTSGWIKKKRTVQLFWDSSTNPIPIIPRYDL